MDSPDMIPSTLVSEIEGVAEQERWLIEHLWSANGVGIVGGTPKTGKTWFTLELAVSVASGKPALSRFEVPNPGPVVVFPAEDDPRAVRDRVAGLAKNKGIVLDGLPLHLITAKTLRLDEDSDRRGLAAMLDRIRPKLVVLDPLVRLHGGDENHLGHIAELLGYMRGLQREFGCAILLTHHIAKRRSAKGAQMGQALRGSGELHAWGDSNIYLTRTEEGLVRVQLEHRAAASLDPLHVQLKTVGESTYLELIEGVTEDDSPVTPERRTVESRRISAQRQSSRSMVPLRDRVLAALSAMGEPMSQADIRDVVRGRNQVLTEELRKLELEEVILRPGGKRRWALATNHAAD